MIRGTTASFVFTLPIEASKIDTVEIKFWQRNNYGTPDAPLPIVKSDVILTQNPKQIGVTLTAEETRRFSEKRKASVQGIITDTQGIKYGIKEQLITVYPIYSGADANVRVPAEDGIVVLDGNNI